MPEDGTVSSVEVKPEDPGVVSAAAPTPAQDQATDFVLFGGQLLPRCKAVAKSGVRCARIGKLDTSFCKLHATRAFQIPTEGFSRKPQIQLPNDLSRDIKALRGFLSKLTGSPLDDPKLLNRVNELIKLVGDLNEKFKATVTEEQIRQLAFYFGSILFKYISDGQRYEMAKDDFMEAILQSGLYDQKTLAEKFTA